MNRSPVHIRNLTSRATMSRRTKRATALLVSLAIGLSIWQLSDGESQPNAGSHSQNTVRIAARSLDDGRTEVALQRLDSDGWGARIAPEARFIPSGAEAGQWFHSSSIALSQRSPQAMPLKIALLQTIGGTDQERRRSFKLAIDHINQAGGVNGQPVIGVIADINFDTDFAVAVARRLIEEEGVHAFVGPNTSSASLALIETIIPSYRIPAISHSATAPALTEADEVDFFFRAVPSDSAQGPVLAQLASEQGYEQLGLIYRDDAWGRGLAGTFRAAWDGGLSVAKLDPQADSCLEPLQQAAAEDADALIVLTFHGGASLCVGQAIELGIFGRFLFGDAAQSLLIGEQIGPEAVAGMLGTASTSGPVSDSSRHWQAGYAAVWGETPATSLAYIRAVYDATIALALAAHSARSTEGQEIRDHLRSVSDGRGETYTAAQLADALQALERGESIDYLGVESSLAWDEHGDVTRFQIGIWRFTVDGQIEVIRRIPFDLSP